MTTQRTVDEWLRLAYRSAPDCPPPVVFLEAEWRELTPDEQQLIEQHLSHCPACSAERDLAQAFDHPAPWTGEAEAGLRGVLARIGSAGASAADESDKRARHSRLLRFPSLPTLLSGPAMGLAAAAVVVLTVGVVLQTRGTGPPDLPGAPTSEVTRGARLRLVEPRGAVTAAPESLTWEAVEDVVRYEVTLTGVDETVLFRGESRTESIAVPKEIRSVLQPAVVYFWQVDAFNESGSRVAWSSATEFRIAPAPVRGELQ